MKHHKEFTIVRASRTSQTAASRPHDAPAGRMSFSALKHRVQLAGLYRACPTRGFAMAIPIARTAPMSPALAGPKHAIRACSSATTPCAFLNYGLAVNKSSIFCVSNYLN